jgi:hypothetical protein
MHNSSILLFVTVSFISYATTVIKVIEPESENDLRQNYYRELLKLSLEKTKDKYGNYKIENVDAGLQGRRSKLLAEGSPLVDIIWTMTNIEREETMLPVRIPLLKGLMGCRIFIINKKDKEKFKNIKTLEELKKLTALQGHDWPDTEILIANGFKVEKASNYEGMFKMMKYGRADYFPRGINEPFDEIKLRPNLNLMVDDNIMLYYFAPFYFFVNVKKKELRDRIEEGLKIAIEDGSFDKLFYNDISNKEMLKKIDFRKRKIYRLENPFLTKETKILQNKKEYLYDFNIN